MRNPSKSTPGCSSGESPGLEATYEESKRGVHDDHPGPPPFVCYEESKLVYPGMLGGGEACVWKLPMRNPTPTSVRNSGLTDGVLEATYEESKPKCRWRLVRSRPG